jgi:hypothetical protein
MSRTFRFIKHHQKVKLYRYSHFADIRDSQPKIDDVVIRGILSSEVVYTTRPRHSSQKYPHYTSHWDDQVKGCWMDRANDDYWRDNSNYDRRKKINVILTRQRLQRFR